MKDSVTDHLPQRRSRGTQTMPKSHTSCRLDPKYVREVDVTRLDPKIIRDPSQCRRALKSLVQLHTSPKREAWAACRNTDSSVTPGWTLKSLGKFLRVGWTQKSLGILARPKSVTLPLQLFIVLGFWCHLLGHVPICWTAVVFATLCVVFLFSVLGSGPVFFLKYLDERILIFVSAPGLRRKSRGDGDGGGLAARTRQMLSFCLLLSASCSLASLVRSSGNNRGRVVERRLPARTQGRTVGRTPAVGADYSLSPVQVSFKTSLRVSLRMAVMSTKVHTPCVEPGSRCVATSALAVVVVTILMTGNHRPLASCRGTLFSDRSPHMHGPALASRGTAPDACLLQYRIVVWRAKPQVLQLRGLTGVVSKYTLSKTMQILTNLCRGRSRDLMTWTPWPAGLMPWHIISEPAQLSPSNVCCAQRTWPFSSPVVLALPTCAMLSSVSGRVELFFWVLRSLPAPLALALRDAELDDPAVC